MKQRLDLFLVENGFFDTRAKAQANIIAGNVLVNDEPITKAGTQINIDSQIRLRNQLEYVSRGAYKLKKALEEFNINPQDCVCADIGSSTGGFTDLLLKKGAKLVYAIDVGTNQLDYSLRTNDKVIVMENTNARYLTPKQFDEKPSLITIDVSFISLTLLFGVLIDILTDNGDIIALIKPQFEVGKDIPHFKGVVRNEKDHINALKKIYSFLENLPVTVMGFTISPIKGPKGNIEFLVHIKKQKALDKKHFDDDYFSTLIDYKFFDRIS